MMNSTEDGTLKKTKILKEILQSITDSQKEGCEYEGADCAFCCLKYCEPISEQRIT